MNGTMMCDCSEDGAFHLSKMSGEDRVNGTRHVGMKQIVALPCELHDYGKFKDLGPEGRDLVNWCVDFLQLKKRLDCNGEANNFPKYFYEKGRGWFFVKSRNDDITISSFIRFFLKIEDGYDYWLMNFLNWNGFMEHGTAIRFGWYNRNHCKGKKYRRHVKKERKRAIFSWIESAPEKWDWSEGKIDWEAKIAEVQEKEAAERKEAAAAAEDTEKAKMVKAEREKDEKKRQAFEAESYLRILRLASAQSMEEFGSILNSKK